VKNIVGEMPEIGKIILSAFLMRRALLQESAQVGPLVVGSRYSSDTLRIREFLSRNRIPHAWEDVESSPSVSKTLSEFQVTEAETPIVVLPSGDLMRIPSNRDLGAALGINRPIESRIYDLVIVGAGPAGLAAAVYGASEGLSTVLIDTVGPGGQAGTSSRIENYMGFPSGLSGQDLADRGVVQAERFGAEMVVPGTVTSISCKELGGHELEVDCLGRIESRCVILAPGAKYRELDVPDFERFLGRGIYHSATHVERILCGESSVAVVGAGNSAGQAAVFLAERAKSVALVVRGSDLRRTMSSYLAARIERSSKIRVMLNSEICYIIGDDHVERVAIVDRNSGAVCEEEVKGVFVMIGAVPQTSWLPAAIERDAKGFILTGPQLIQEGKWRFDRAPFLLETSCQGVFAAGDVRCGSVKRVASSVGEGSMAVAFVHQFLAL
jgi:thioredoxin reductase (NADPH)